MKIIKIAGVILAASLTQGAWATTAEPEVKVDALNEQQLNDEMPYLEALMAGEDLMSESSEADIFRRGGHRGRDGRHGRDGRRGRDRRDRDRDRNRGDGRDDNDWRRPPPRHYPAPRRVACFARNVRTGVVYRAVGWGNNRGLQNLAVRACRNSTRFDRACRPMGCRRFR